MFLSLSRKFFFFLRVAYFNQAENFYKYFDRLLKNNLNK